MSRITSIFTATLLFCSFLIGVAYSKEGELAAVRSEGASAKRNRETAREDAIKVALRKAIGGKIGEIARLSLGEKIKIERVLKDDPENYVAKYDIIQETPRGKWTRVVLDVYVMADRLVDKLIELGFTANLIYKPRILVIINENVEGKRVSRSILTTLIAKKLVDNGFKTVTPKSSMEARRILRKLEESEDALAELRKKYNCDVIITGESDVEVMQINRGPYKKSWGRDGIYRSDTLR